jgi:hypothetical protein
VEFDFEIRRTRLSVKVPVKVVELGALRTNLTSDPLGSKPAGKNAASPGAALGRLLYFAPSDNQFPEQNYHPRIEH